MIQLTRLNKKPLLVNSDMIKFIENTPDTVITLVTGEKVVVLETAERVLEQIVDFRRRLMTPTGGTYSLPEEVSAAKKSVADKGGQ